MIQPVESRANASSIVPNQDKNGINSVLQFKFLFNNEIFI